MLALKEIYIQSHDWEENALKRMVNFEDELIVAEFMQLWQKQKIDFLYNFFIDKDTSNFKNSLYNCARIDEILVKKYHSRLLDAGMENISYVLLSDNLDIIIGYARLGHSEYAWMVEHGHSTLAFAVQQSIIENWEKVQ